MFVFVNLRIAQKWYSTKQIMVDLSFGVMESWSNEGILLQGETEPAENKWSFISTKYPLPKNLHESLLTPFSL